MLSAVLQLIHWLFRKFASVVLIVSLGLAAGSLWLFLKDSVDFEEWRRDLVRTVSGERAKVQAAMADVQARLAAQQAEIAADQERAKQTDKVIAELKDLESTWDRLVGDRAQQLANAERLEKLQAQRLKLAESIRQRQLALRRTGWERDGLAIALEKVDARLKAAEREQTRLVHYLERAWEYRLGVGIARLPVKWWVLSLLALYLVGPAVGRYALYHGWATLVERGRPVRLAPTMAAMPVVADSRVAAELSLQPGERLWVKEQFLQASDEGLRRRTRALLDWRLPFTCLATGLFELIEMENGGPAEQRLTLSNQADPHSELAVVTLPAGASLILRPTFLAGLALPAAQALTIRRRWQPWRWQAWVTLQFRFFEFVGPSRLLIAGRRGIRIENLAERAGDAVPARRTNQDATVGFTPNLDYRPVRAETFWSYYRGMNPLFDDLFSGRGIFLCQQVATPGEAQKTRRFWSALWAGLLKAFGM